MCEREALLCTSELVIISSWIQRLVVLFGVTVTGLVIYAVSSELFASNSPTKIYEEMLEIVKHNTEVNSILLQPIRFHAESSGGRRNRRVRSTLSVDKANGRERMTIHFLCEGRSVDSAELESWTQTAKRWIRPIVVEPSAPLDLLPSPPVPLRAVKEKAVDAASYSASNWFGSLFGSLLPSAFAKSGGDGHEEAHPERLKSKPAPGTFLRGEAVASLLTDDKGKFQLDSLVVFYPGKLLARLLRSL